jgi:hydroxymethylpyrimidine/phosphomethylpyrimidine kinase
MKVVLTIAGSDSSGGAGIQADLKTFEAHGVYGASVVTVLTAQNTKGVTDISSVTPQFVKAQLDAIFDDLDVAAIKIGMLFSNEIIDVVREYIKNLTIPIVFDPVFISKAGSKLLQDDAIENMKSLLPYATITTPNLFEAKELFGFEALNSDSLDGIFNAPCSVLIKNHIHTMNEKEKSIDMLFQGRDKSVYMTPYITTNNTHGTGCSYSSAIAANLALGHDLHTSVHNAKNFVYESIIHAPNIGHGKGVINHHIGGKICLEIQN